MQCAVLRSHVVHPSVRPSVRDVGDLWSHRLEILETNCTGNLPITFTLCSQKAIRLLPWEYWEILGRLKVGYGKMAFWRTKAAISLKRIKMEEKLLWRAYRNSRKLFRTVPSPTPYGCWLGLLTCKTVSRITYTVLVETLNPAQSNPTPYGLPFLEIGGRQLSYPSYLRNG